MHIELIVYILYIVVSHHFILNTIYKVDEVQDLNICRVFSTFIECFHDEYKFNAINKAY